VIARSPWLIVGLAVAMIVIKAAVIFVLGRMFGMKSGRALSLGLLLSQAGEFGFVLFGQAAAAQLITPEAASLFGAVVTLSMASTPFLMRLIDWLQARMPDEMVDLEGPATSPETNAIVVGYGRFGQTVSQMLMAKGISVTLIDSKPSQIELAEEFGTKVYYGDGTRIDLLRTAGAAEAEAILFCNDGEATNRQSMEAILKAFPQAAIMVRAFDRRQLIELRGLGIAFAQRELFESAVTMGRRALLKLGIARREVDRVESEYRSRDCERLELQGATGDLHALEETVFRPGYPLADAPAEPSA
jgi:glutathione-regulated potassium-efflux system protein KefB